MNPALGEILNDRADLDPQPNQVKSLLRRSFRYTYHFDTDTYKHTLQLHGLGKYLLFGPQDHQHTLFSLPIKYHNIPIPTQDLNFQLTEFLRTINLPVALTDDPNVRYNWLLASYLRSVARNHAHVKYKSNTAILNYVYGENPFYKILQLIHADNPIQERIRTSISIPQIQPNIFDQTTNTRLTTFWNVYHEQEINTLIGYLVGRGLRTTHISHSWNAFHTFDYADVNDMYEHQCRTLLESWRDFRDLQIRTKRSVNRRSQILLQLSDNELSIMIQALTSVYDLDKLVFIEQTDDPIATVRSLASQYISTPIYQQAIEHYRVIYLPAKLKTLRHTTPMYEYPLIIFTGEVPEEENLRIVNTQYGIVNLLVEPFGDPFTYETTFAGTPTFQIRRRITNDVRALAPNQFSSHRYPGTITTWDDMTHAQQYLEAKQFLDSPMPETAYDLNNRTRPLDQLNHLHMSMIKDIGDIYAISRFSTTHFFLQCSIQERIPYSANGLIWPPTDFTIRRINNSTYKMCALFRYAFMLSQQLTTIIPKVTFWGVENEPAIDILMKMYDIEINGIGERALNYTRGRIGYLPTFNLASGIIISDIEIQGDDIDVITEQYVRLAVHACNSQIAIIKIVPGLPYIINSIITQIRTMSSTKHMEIILPNGRKALSSEVYLLIRTLAIDDDSAQLYYEDSDAIAIYINHLRDQEYRKLTYTEFVSHTLPSGPPQNDDDLSRRLGTIYAISSHQDNAAQVINCLSQHCSRVQLYKRDKHDVHVCILGQPTFERMVLGSRAITTLGTTERTITIPFGFGQSTNTLSKPHFTLIEATNLIRLVIHHAVRMDIKKLITTSPNHSFIRMIDIGGRNMTGLSLLENLSEVKYELYEYQLINDTNWANYNAAYYRGLYEWNRIIPANSVVLALFVLQSPVQPSDQLTALTELSQATKQSNGTVTYFTYFHHSIADIIRRSLDPIPNVQMTESGMVQWATYDPISTLTDSEVQASVGQFDALLLDGRLVNETCMLNRVFPAPHTTSYFLDLLKAVRVCRVSPLAVA
ncbi:VP4 [Lutzomyia reovirus 1]|uniref:VP4 n=1 Tax=Lutzomyia reovirus 1 TaxID=1670669 RepID=UPI00065EE4C1|nr:VP4 [Lutzomyia reovirus 1]AKP18605.1 VP4 [Lutzomyia reovirus 1]